MENIISENIMIIAAFATGLFILYRLLRLFQEAGFFNPVPSIRMDYTNEMLKLIGELEEQYDNYLDLKKLSRSGPKDLRASFISKSKTARWVFDNKLYHFKKLKCAWKKNQ